MNKHHDELVQEFQQVIDIRNRVKEELDLAGSGSENGSKSACMENIDHWETETVERIRALASRARVNVDELIKKKRAEIRYQFEQISNDVKERQKSGNYLETDIDTVKRQLEELKTRVSNIYTNIRVNATTQNEIAWDTLILVTDESGKCEDRVERRKIAEETPLLSHRGFGAAANGEPTLETKSEKDAGMGKLSLVSFFHSTSYLYVCREKVH